MSTSQVAYWLVVGSLSQTTGDILTQKTKMINAEKEMGTQWEPIDDEYFELVISRDAGLHQKQAVFAKFPDLDEWHTKDIFRRHPTIPYYFKYQSQIDDATVFSTGEKMNLTSMEAGLNSLPGANASLVVGHKRPYPILLVELASKLLGQPGVTSSVSSYTDLVPAILRRLRSDCQGVETLAEWNEKLASCTPTPPAPTTTSISGSGSAPAETESSMTAAQALLELYQGLASNLDQPSVIFDTAHTVARIPGLKDAGPVKEAWIEIWLDQWGFRSDSTY
ncbi:hypothetical protein BDW59DRAFT_158935 [Aspergillus cavernicola]|uniref:Uncharacterized protein n=1 Tax=Aspergillus cavernicola TaxID=176166 RepID=A0ABR4IPR4_9EURO